MKKKKGERERYCPECRSYNLIYQVYESALGIKGNIVVCKKCGFKWSVDWWRWKSLYSSNTYQICMEIIKKVITTGTSLCVVIDKIIADTLKIKKGDLVKVNVRKVKEDD